MDIVFAQQVVALLKAEMDSKIAKKFATNFALGD